MNILYIVFVAIAVGALASIVSTILIGGRRGDFNLMSANSFSENITYSKMLNSDISIDSIIDDFKLLPW